MKRSLTALLLSVLMLMSLLPVEAIAAELDEIPELPEEVVETVFVPEAEEQPAEPVTEPIPTEEPIVYEPVIEEPVVEEPVVEEPVVEEPVVEEPVVEEPAVEEPVAEESVVEEPVTAEGPVTVEPLTEEPVTEESTAEEPLLEDSPEEIEPADEEEQLCAVVFRCEPEALTLTVYSRQELERAEREQQEPQPIEQEAEHSYLLWPGEYVYSANSEGYESVEKALFAIGTEETEKTVVVTLTRSEPVSQEPEIADNELERPQPVRVEFICEPEETVITVYDSKKTDENGEPLQIEQEENGTYLLIPGKYLYDFECKGYESVKGTVLEIENNNGTELRIVLKLSDRQDGSMMQAQSSSSEWYLGYDNADGVSGSWYTDRPALISRLDSVFHGNTNIFSDSDRKNPVNTALGTKSVPNNGKTQYVGNTSYSGTSCAVYAAGVYFTLFGNAVSTSGTLFPSENKGSYKVNIGSGGKLTYENLKKWGVNQGVGAYIRLGNHSIIVLAYSQDFLKYIDGNGDGKGGVYIREQSWGASSNVRRGYTKLWTENISTIVQPTTELFDSLYPRTGSSSPITAALDINGYLDGSDSGNIDGYGTFDLYIKQPGTDWEQVAFDDKDFCRDLPQGTEYRIEDINGVGIHTFHGLKQGSAGEFIDYNGKVIHGTLGASRQNVELVFRTNDNLNEKFNFGNSFYAYITSRDGKHQLYNNGSGNVATEGASTAASHVWYFERMNDSNQYKISSAVDGWAFDVTEANKAPGTNLEVIPFRDNNLCQLWVCHEEGGYVEIGSPWTPCVVDRGDPNAYLNLESQSDQNYCWFKIQKTD